jgi:hypothetical protein
MNKLELSINVSVYQQSTGGRLEVKQKFTLGPGDFTEICKILGQFHDLAEKIRKQDAAGPTTQSMGEPR